LRVFSVDPREVHATHLRHTDQLVDLALDGRTRGCDELEVEVGERRVDPYLLELDDRAGFVVDQSDVTEHDPGDLIEPVSVVDASETNVDRVEASGPMTPVQGGADLQARSTGDHVLRRLTEPECPQHLAAGNHQQADLRVLQRRLVVCQLGDVGRTPDPPRGTVP
jgi:hypothetical protein